MSLSSRTSRGRAPEQGFVAILTVLFFIVLVSVLSISFLRLMTDNNNQVENDDLTKGALAAADSGVEDAKRALRYCRAQTGATQTQCYDTINNNTNCPGIYKTGSPLDFTASSALGLNRLGDDSIQIGDSGLNERTTCTIVTLSTDDVIGQARQTLGDLIPLRSNSPFNQLTVQWHQLATDGTPALPDLATVSTGNVNSNPPVSQWQDPVTGKAYPAMLRVQLMSFNPGGQTLSDLSNQSWSVFLVPSSAGTNATSLPGSTRQVIACSTSNDYACTASIDISSLPAGMQYYALITSMYGSPDYRLTLGDSGTPAPFYDVEPSIDVTGVTSNVYRRVISRVFYQSDSFYTPNALDVGTALCKDLETSGNGSTSDSGCLDLP